MPQSEFVSDILENMLDGAMPEDQYEYPLQQQHRPKVYLNATRLGPDGCSEECLGGCAGSAENCVACRSFKYGAVCVAKCPRCV